MFVFLPAFTKKLQPLRSQHKMTLNDFVKTALVYAVNHEKDIDSDLSDKEYGF